MSDLGLVCVYYMWSACDVYVVIISESDSESKTHMVALASTRNIFQQLLS